MFKNSPVSNSQHSYEHFLCARHCYEHFINNYQHTESSIWLRDEETEALGG